MLLRTLKDFLGASLRNQQDTYKQIYYVKDVLSKRGAIRWRSYSWPRIFFIIRLGFDSDIHKHGKTVSALDVRNAKFKSKIAGVRHQGS